MEPLPTDVAQFLMGLSGRPVPGNIQFRYKFVVVFLAAIIIDSMFFMIVKWHDVKLRLFAFEDVLINLFGYFIFMYFALNPVETKNLIDVINRKNFVVKYNMTRRQKDIMNNRVFVKQKTMKLVLATVTVYNSCNCFLPVIIGTFKIFTDLNYDKIEELPLAFESLYPFQFMKQSLYSYYTLIAIQSFCIIGEALVFGVWCILAILAFLTIETELELLVEMLRDIDIVVNGPQMHHVTQSSIVDDSQLMGITKLDDMSSLNNGNNFMKFVNSEEILVLNENKELALRGYLKNFVLHHQSIIRVVKEVHKSTNFLTFMLNQIVCCQICISLYSTFSLEGAFLKLRSFLTAFATLANFGLFCLYGQSLIDKSDNLKCELMSCSWLDKPLWFKKSLCFIMARSDSPLQIKPLGLYILNMQNFFKVINASYSYYNVLLNFRKD